MDNRPVRILVDTNVALDLLLNREPFAIDALQLFALAEAEKVELLLSTDAISTIFYVVRKNCDSSVAREALAKLLDYVALVALDERAVIRGLATDFADVEDALVAAVAEKTGAAAIVTRNLSDFSPLPYAPLALVSFLPHGQRASKLRLKKHRRRANRHAFAWRRFVTKRKGKTHAASWRST